VYNKLTTFLKVRINLKIENPRQHCRESQDRPNSELRTSKHMIGGPQVEGVHDSFQDQRTDEFLKHFWCTRIKLILQCNRITGNSREIQDQGTTHFQQKKAPPRTTTFFSTLSIPDKNNKYTLHALLFLTH
jgi:hypothetical protein